MATDSRLAGRKILVTGAGRGIGSAVARGCASAGADVALTSRNTAALEEIGTRIRRLGRRGEALPADARDESEVERVVDAAFARLGGIDSAILCHGVNRLARIQEMGTGTWREVLETNLTASFFFARALARRLNAAGAIVFLSSVSALPGYRKFPRFAAYCAAKRGLLGLAEVLALELQERDTRVYALCPRGVDTEMFRESFPGQHPELRPDEVAARIIELLDPVNAPETGAVVEM